MSTQLTTWETQERNNRRKSAVLTAIITLIVLILCIILGFREPYPPPEEQGILIDFGNVEDGFGELEPTVNNTPVAQPVVEQVVETVEETVTQEFEESVALPEKKIEEKPKEIIKPEKKPEPTPVVKEEVVVEKEPEVDPNLMFNKNKFDFKNNSQSEGDKKGTGNMGVEDGDPDADNYFGDKSTGLGDDGIGFSLSGRAMKKRPIIEGGHQQIGRIMIDIRVDRNGNVISATFRRKGSNIVDHALIKKAEDAAMKAKFDQNTSAPEIQSGTISFNLKLK